jgi:transposase
MSNRSFEMYEYRQVLVRMRQGDSDRQIAAARLMGRSKAAKLRRVARERGWLEAEHPLPDDTALAEVLGQRETHPGPSSQVEPHRERILAWKRAGITGTTIHQALVREHGFSGSYSAIRRFLQANEPIPLKATVRLDFAPAEAAQVDFGAGPRILDTDTGELRKTWVFVMTLCFSRHQYAELIWRQDVATWLACHRHAFEWFNGVPKRVIIDNAKCAIILAHRRDPEVQRAYAECAEGYGFKIDACPPREPQLKGRVEAGVKYLKQAFLALREFRSLPDANAQLRQWILAEAGNRLHGTTRAQPLALFESVEKALLARLPDVPPELAIWAKLKVHRDAHVQFERAYYSVPFRLLGQTLWLKATPDVVRLYQAHQLVATHVRQHRPGARSTVADHMPPNALAYAMRDPQWCLTQANAVGPQCQALIERLFADRVLEHLRAAQGVIRLGEKYGKARLEAACQRALSFDNPRYRSVKTILEKGLDQQPDAVAAFDTLAESYTGGARFLRDASELLSH